MAIDILNNGQSKLTENEKSEILRTGKIPEKIDIIDPKTLSQFELVTYFNKIYPVGSIVGMKSSYRSGVIIPMEVATRAFMDIRNLIAVVHFKGCKDCFPIQSSVIDYPKPIEH